LYQVSFIFFVIISAPMYRGILLMKWFALNLILNFFNYIWWI